MEELAKRLGDIVAGEPLIANVTGSSGSGKTTTCRRAFEQVGARVVEWDPLSTSMVVPSLIDSYTNMAEAERIIVVFADDVDVATRSIKGGGTMLADSIHTWREQPCCRLRRVALVATMSTEERVTFQLTRAFDVHIQQGERCKKGPDTIKLAHDAAVALTLFDAAWIRAAGAHSDKHADDGKMASDVAAEIERLAPHKMAALVSSLDRWMLS